MHQQRQSLKQKISAYWKLFNYGRSKNLLLLLLLSLVSSAAHGVSTPLAVYLFGQLINSYEHSFSFPSRASREVARVVHSVLYVAAATLFSASAQVISSTLVGERLASRMVINYFEALLSQEIGFHDLRTSTGDLVGGISSDVVLVQNAMGCKLAACVQSLSIFLAGSIILLSLCWSLGIIGLAVSPLLLAVGVAYVTFFAKYSAMVSRAYNDANQVAEQAFAQVRSVYASVGEITVLSRISHHLNNATRLANAAGFSKGLGLGVACSIAYGAWAVEFAYASGLVQKGLLDAGTVFAMVTMSLYCGKALADCLQALELVIKGSQAGARLLEVVERKSTIDARVSEGHVPQKILGHIEFDHISFAYPSAPERRVFSDFSLEIPSCKTFAIVGTSGSGKSSLISLIERFYDPDKGEVRIDGTDIRKLQLKWLRNQIGLVNQEPLLFAMSIKQNIQLGKPHATDEEIQAAAKISNAHSFISDLPEGYGTQIGNNLSGGQRQRLAIARAVLRDPAIMLLDEATSALDPPSELLVQDALDKTVHGRTTLLIAHRLSTVMQADQIAVLHEGRIVETGTHEQLMKKTDGRYAHLFQLQQTHNSIRQPVDSECRRSMALDEDQSDQELTNKTEVNQTSFITWFFDCCSKARITVIFASLGAVVSGLLMAALPLLFSNVILAFIVRQEHKAELWIHYIGILAVVNLPSTILQYVCSYKSGAIITQQVQESALTGILKNEVGWFESEENNSISITTELSRNSATIRNTVSDTYSSFLQNVVAVCAALVIGYIFQWKMALLSSLMLPVYVLGNAVSHKYLNDEETQASYSGAIRVIGGAVSSLRTVQSFSAEEELSSNVRKHLRKASRTKLRRATIAGTIYGASQGILQAANALIMWYGVNELMRGREDMASTLTSFTVISYTSNSCIELLKLVPELYSGVKAVKSMFHYSSRRTMVAPDQPDAKDNMELKGGIEFQNVSFAYPSRPDKMVLNGFSLKIKSGSTVVLVGRSGCGKSSTLALVERFYEPTNGRLLMDGRDVKLFNLRSLRRQIGYVQQEPVLLSATVRENITFGCERVVGETELIRAATLAGAHGFISGLPQGYETDVGERCIQLSGGQRQRLAIARAILRKPAILMLDEATSALDAETEKVVNDGLQASAAATKSTVVVVAHRLSTLSSSEGATIVVMEGGRAVERGSHFELLERGGAYSRLSTYLPISPSINL